MQIVINPCLIQISFLFPFFSLIFIDCKINFHLEKFINKITIKIKKKKNKTQSSRDKI